jgi:hypothetical protein
MKPQYQHKVMTSFLLWFDNHLLTQGEAFSNKTGTLHYFDDSRLPSSYKAYASPYKQWVTDSSVTGSTNPTIPTSFMGSGRSDGIIFDFENGRIIETGNAFGETAVITGTFAVKDFNVYLTNETEEDLILENKYVQNSRYTQSESGIKPYDQAVPAIFINQEVVNNVPFAFGGEDETRMTIKAVVLAEDTYSLDGVLSIFADSRHKNITLIPFSGHPATEYGDLDGGSYNYTGVEDSYKNSEEPLYIENVTVSKLSDRAKKQAIGDLKVGFIDFDVYQHRFPR